MKKCIPIINVIVCMILTSCVTSLHPITEKENDLVFKKELLGNWVDKDSVHYILEGEKGKGGKFYHATVIDPRNDRGSGNFSDTSYFTVALASIKGKLFLDCVADMEQFENKNLGEPAVSSVIPTHFIIPVASIKPNAIELSPIDHDKLLDLLQGGKFEINSELVKKTDVLFTEKPENLQKKLIELENFPAVFSISVLNRATN
jgi:hypothetical protein